MNTGLIVVDVQPAYDKWCRSIAYQVAKRINNTRKPTTIVWVGEDFTRDTEDDVREYLHDAGARPGKLATCAFVEKDYGFFRSWMDMGVAREDIITVGRAMLRSSAYGSEDLDLTEILGPDCDLDSLTGEPLRRPSFDDRRLREFSTFETCGGGSDECLAEFELYLEMQDKPFSRLRELVY